jgi:Uma2 family endonuclease
MAASPFRHRYSFEDYLGVEEISRVRHEYLDGEIVAMAGGTPEHAALSAAVVTLLGGKLRGGPGRPYSADLRIRVRATGLATYPDAAVICGEPVRDPESPTHVTNPAVIVEVLSPSTEDYDRGEKQEHYRRIDSLKEYVLVSQDRRRVEVFHRDATGTWEARSFKSGDEVEVASLGVRFGTDELYDLAGTRFP